MIRTQIYLPKSQLDKLRQKARRENATVSHVIRIMIGADLAPRRAKNKKSESFTEAVRRINKLGTRAPRDLARNMDKYLYGNV